MVPCYKNSTLDISINVRLPLANYDYARKSNNCTTKYGEGSLTLLQLLFCWCSNFFNLEEVVNIVVVDKQAIELKSHFLLTLRVLPKKQSHKD